MFWKTIALAVAVLAPVVATAAAPAADKPTVILVHGAFADGSSWNRVIPMLEAKGLNVIAVQNPLSSLADDVSATRRAIEAAPGKVILVGHSWAGAVITEAGADPKVSGLVYVAAFVLDANQSVSDLLAGKPAPPWFAGLVKDSGNFLKLATSDVSAHFAQDVPAAEAHLMSVTQGPWAARCQTDKVTVASWKTKPSWYAVAANDHMIAPELQKASAAQIKATTVTIASSHVPMISHPKEVADLIVAAANGAK